MLYVHVVEQHRWSIPELVLACGAREIDPDERVLAMLGAREQRANENQKPAEIRMISAG